MRNTVHTNVDKMMFAAAPKAALDIIDKLERAGYEAYLVGGCVRDTLKGQSPHDWDITTSATPEQMKEAVDYKSVDTGLQHGTITFMVNDEPYETTVFRTDGEYSDGRHPDSVKFADTVEEDLARRDFTVNAMAWSPRRGLVDPYGGEKDLTKKLLRGVGEPKERFEEDGLRIMRAVRFAAVHGFDIESNTAKAMHETLSMLDNVSEERITSEFLKTLGASDGKHVKEIIMEFSDVMFKAVPELALLNELKDQDNKNHDRTLFEHSLDVMAGLPADPVLRFSGLVHDIGKPASRSVGEDGQSHYYGHMDEGRRIVEAMCERMKISNEDKARMSFLVENHDNRPRETERSARRFIVKMGNDEMLSDMLALMESDIKAHSEEAVERVMPRFNAAKAHIAEEKKRSLAMQVKDLAINGNDLMSMGWTPGPEMGAILNEMFASVVDGKMENDATVLKAYADKAQEEISCGERTLFPDRKSFIREDGSSCSSDIDDMKAGISDASDEGYAENDVRDDMKKQTRSSSSRHSFGKGDGRVYVSSHVRGGVKVSGYYRSAPGHKSK